MCWKGRLGSRMCSGETQVGDRSHETKDCGRLDSVAPIRLPCFFHDTGSEADVCSAGEKGGDAFSLPTRHPFVSSSLALSPLACLLFSKYSVVWPTLTTATPFPGHCPFPHPGRSPPRRNLLV